LLGLIKVIPPYADMHIMKIFFYIVGFCSGLLFHRQKRKKHEVEFLGYEAFGQMATMKFGDLSGTGSTSSIK
jgi:hypothetical protein